MPGEGAHLSVGKPRENAPSPRNTYLALLDDRQVNDLSDSRLTDELLAGKRLSFLTLRMNRGPELSKLLGDKC